MIENMNDLISLALITILFLGFGYLNLRNFIHQIGRAHV